MIFAIYWLLGWLSGIGAVLLGPGTNSPAEVCQTLLFYQLSITLSLSGLTSFIGHVFKSDFVAEKIGWDTGSPFQKELGFAQLGFAIVGFASIWQGNEFRLAAILCSSPLYFLAGIKHIKEMIINKNYHSHNTWTIIPDILMPLSWIILFILSYR